MTDRIGVATSPKQTRAQRLSNQARVTAACAAEFCKIVDSVRGKSVAIAERVDFFERNVTVKIEVAEMKHENAWERLARDCRLLKWMTAVWVVLSVVILVKLMVQ